MRWALKRLLKHESNLGRSQFVNVEGGTRSLSNVGQSEHLLCHDCEQRLGKDDGYAADVARRLDGSFSASESAVKTDVCVDDDVSSIGLWSVSSLDCDALTRFAASTFWRASVGSRRQFSPGAYEEPFREFLYIDQAPFPENSWLVMTLFAPKDPVNQIDIGGIVPHEQRLSAYHRGNQFRVWGLDFQLLLGPEPPALYLIAHLPKSKLAAVSEGTAEWNTYAQLMNASPREGALANEAGDTIIPDQ